MDAAKPPARTRRRPHREARCTASPSASRTSSTLPACRPRPTRKSWSITSPNRTPSASPTARRRRHRHGQAQHARVRHRRAELRPAVPAGAQSVEPAAPPGGSSSGSGAGVASGMFPLGTRHRHRRFGAQSGERLRHCRPEADLWPVSRRGVFPLAFTLDHVGPMTRTVADNALLLEVLAGHDPRDPGSAQTSARHLAQRSTAVWTGLRDRLHSSLPRNGYAGPSRCHRRAGGCRTHPGGRRRPRQTVTLPKLSEFAGVNRVILCSEAWSIHAPGCANGPEIMARWRGAACCRARS